MKRPCPYCGNLYEADNAWHSLNIHLGHCKQNPDVIKMNQYHDEQDRLRSLHKEQTAGGKI